MTLKTGCKTIWDDIEVGEVFAWDGCWYIFEKISENKIRDLASDYKKIWFDALGEIKDVFNEKSILEHGNLYKLPGSVQRLWKEE